MFHAMWLPLFIFLALPCAARPDEDSVPEGFKPLFNGKDLTGWKVREGGDPKVWGAEKGLLYVNGKGGDWLMTEKEYSDFELRLEFKLPKAGNSGVALRCALKGNPHLEAGMEIQLLDDPWYLDEKNYKGLKPTQKTGSIYGVVPPSKDALKPVGEWNQMRITANGPRITVELNSEKIVDADLRDHKDKAKEHKGMLNSKGHLGLQSHDGRVEFRRLYVKELTKQ
jgi:hypothetical protein